MTWTALVPRPFYSIHSRHSRACKVESHPLLQSLCYLAVLWSWACRAITPTALECVHFCTCSSDKGRCFAMVLDEFAGACVLGAIGAQYSR